MPVHAKTMIPEQGGVKPWSMSLEKKDTDRKRVAVARSKKKRDRAQCPASSNCPCGDYGVVGAPPHLIL
jgi:hypothetical protein